MFIINFLLENAALINVISNIFIAVGTVGTVIVALYLSNRNSKPKIKVFASVGVITPEMREHLWISCVNVGMIPVICNSFAFAPYMQKPARIMPIRRLEHLSTNMPCMLNYSEKCDQHFDEIFFSDPILSKFLGKQKWLARLKLKFFWRVMASTNVGLFYGRLPNDIIDKIISSQFAAKKAQEIEQT